MTQILGQPCEFQVQPAPVPSAGAAAAGGGAILAGLLVVDLTTAVAGPAAAVILADLGARVVKVEAPAGDATRTTHRGLGLEDAHGRSYGPAFEQLNRGKESHRRVCHYK